MFASILPTNQELSVILPGDDIIADPNIVIDSAFTLSEIPADVFPWFVQLGKQRAG